MALPVSARSKLALRAFYRRITMNKLTTAFFLFGFIHCFAQAIMHSFLLSIDDDYSEVLSAITDAVGTSINKSDHTYYERDTGKVKLCNYIPHNDDVCIAIFNPRIDLTPADAVDKDAMSRGEVISQSLAVVNVTLGSPDNASAGGVTLRAQDGFTVHLTEQCTKILLFPKQSLQAAWREDLSLVLFQFWLFAISVFAMIYDSVPHILAGFAARFLLTAWSAYTIWRNEDERKVFYNIVGQPGSPCSLDMFQDYFRVRRVLGIPDTILNVSALCIAAYLSWTLLKMYNTQSVKHVGAPEHVFKIYRFVLAVQACSQLNVFVLATAMGLWVDQLVNTYIIHISDYTEVYIAWFIVTTIVLIPWIALGLWAIKREHKRLMLVFLGLPIAFLAGWAAMFYSQVYRWTFYMWPMLGCYTVASMLLIIITFALGVVCRRNFGKGLAEYLRAEAALASSNFTLEVFDHDMEKSPVEGSGADEFTTPYPTYLPQLSKDGRQDGLL